MNPSLDNWLSEAKEKEKPVCLKCGKPGSDTRNIDLYGICDECADRAHREAPTWCNMFRNADGSEPYCDHPELEESGNCSQRPLYQENLEAEEHFLTKNPTLNGLKICPSCGKTVPDSYGCLYCGECLGPARINKRMDRIDVSART